MFDARVNIECKYNRCRDGVDAVGSLHTTIIQDAEKSAKRCLEGDCRARDPSDTASDQ